MLYLSFGFSARTAVGSRNQRSLIDRMLFTIANPPLCPSRAWRLLHCGRSTFEVKRKLQLAAIGRLN